VQNEEAERAACPANRGPAVHPLVRGADLAGTFVFALQGALAAIAGRLDLLGEMVLAFATALGGGVIRDVLMGDLPPSALRGWSYPCTAFLAGALVFALEPYLQVPRGLLVTLDAGGLALFAVAGTEKALDARIHPLSAILLGTITLVGGGTLRHVLLTQVPAILRVDATPRRRCSARSCSSRRAGSESHGYPRRAWAGWPASCCVCSPSGSTGSCRLRLPQRSSLGQKIRFCTHARRLWLSDAGASTGTTGSHLQQIRQILGGDGFKKIALEACRAGQLATFVLAARREGNQSQVLCLRVCA
jgi:uncharacterized membrane protein YeiH